MHQIQDNATYQLLPPNKLHAAHGHAAEGLCIVSPLLHSGIVDNCTDEKKSIYYFITPKLAWVNFKHMDIYLTIEEKYLQAVDELSYGETPKALQLLNAIIADEPFYARAHFQLGKLYYYEIKDYLTAGYHFKTCTELEPLFPDVYEHYLALLVFLKMEKQVHIVAEKALAVAGVNAAAVYNFIGLFAEKKRDWAQAMEAYRSGFLEATGKSEKDNLETSIQRVKDKKRLTKKYNYELSA